MKHTVHFHDVASLSTVRGEFVWSPEFMLLGNQWCLKIYPGGDEGAAEGMVTLRLVNNSNKAIDAEYGFSVNDGNGKQVVYKQSPGPRNFASVGNRSSCWGWGNFASRSDLFSSLVDGTLVIEVRMKLTKPADSVPQPFIPENPSACKIIQGLFMNKKSADIIFEVGADKVKDNAMKVAKIEPVLFPAHSVIAGNCSITFADLFESHGDGTTLISISGVSPDVFRLLLFYMYGGKLSDDDMNSHAKELVDAADRFGVVSLKIEAEAYIVGATTFTMENVMELLLYAESKNLALLKEASMDYILENKAEVIEKLSFADTVPGTLMRDLLVATARGERVVGGSGGDIKSQLADMRINELRRMAHEKCLNVDESREMLIAALKSVQEAVVAQDFLTE